MGMVYKSVDDISRYADVLIKRETEERKITIGLMMFG